MAKTIYVKCGSRCGKGTPDKPFGSLLQAQKEVRRLLSEGETGLRVLLSAGEYQIGSPWFFDETDSGTEAFPVIWEAADGEKVLIHSSRLLAKEDIRPVSFSDSLYPRLPCPEKTYVFDLKKLGVKAPCEPLLGFGQGYGEVSQQHCVPGGLSDFALYEKERAFVPARYPNDGYVTVEDVIGEVDPGKEPNPYSFVYNDPRPETWSSLEGVRMLGYFFYDWADSSVALASMDKEKKTLTMGSRISYGVRKGHRYYYLNIPEELDVPGEWYIDRREGLAYFIPSEDSALTDIRVVTGKENLIRARNASHIVFRNLHLGYTRAAAVDICDGDGIRFEGCEISNAGGVGVLLGKDPKRTLPFGVMGFGGKNHIFRSCDIHDCGFGGLLLYGGDRNTLEPTGITVDNCDIYGFSRIGKTYCFGVSLYTVGANVTHCRIHDAPHSAVYFNGNDNRIEYNELFDVIRESDDASSIYTGRNYAVQGHRICHNYFHDLVSDAETGIGIFGVYADDNSAGIVFDENIFFNVQSAVLFHGGHDLSFSRNLVINRTAKSQYSVRFHAYGYTNTLREGGTHLENLKKVPWQSELWRKRYPHISVYLSWDPDTVQRYPHYCEISGNAFLNHMPMDLYNGHDNPEFCNRVEENLIRSEVPASTPDEAVEYLKQNRLEAYIPFDYHEAGLYQDEFRK